MQEINEQHITDGPIMDAATPDRSGNPDAMADLLRRFNGEAEYTIDNSLRDPEFGPDLQRALITESSKNDMWKIQLTESASAGKYNIVNSLSRKSFFEGITLMGAAKRYATVLKIIMRSTRQKFNKCYIMIEFMKIITTNVRILKDCTRNIRRQITLLR